MDWTDIATSAQRPWRRFLGVILLVCAACSAQQDQDPDRPLSVLLPREALEIDPRFSGDPYGHKLSRLLFSSLVTIDPHTLEVVPDLARRVEMLSPTRYRVELRPGLRFSDGSALDTEDVASTYRGVVDPALGSRYANLYRRISRTKVIDELRIEFELDAPHATFLTDLELPIMRAEDEHRHVGVLGQELPVGAGPYRLLSRETSRIELGPNPHWHGGTPRFPRVDMLVIRDDNTRALRLLAGAADLALNAVPPLLVPLFTENEKFEVRTRPGVGTTYLGFNMDAPALRDVRVRRAIAHAIDRALLVRAKLGGRARLARSFVVPGHWAYSERVPQHDYDPARARELLASTGKSAPTEGPVLRLAMRCGNDRFRLSIARALAAMLSDVGVQVEIRPSEVATLIADLNRGRFELTMLQIPEVVEPHVLSWFFGSDHIPGGGSEGANRWRLRDAKLDAALERGRVTSDRSQRAQAYIAAQIRLAERLPIVPLWHDDVVAIGNRRARDFEVPRLGRFGTLAR